MKYISIAYLLLVMEGKKGPPQVFHIAAGFFVVRRLARGAITNKQRFLFPFHYFCLFVSHWPKTTNEQTNEKEKQTESKEIEKFLSYWGMCPALQGETRWSHCVRRGGLTASSMHCSTASSGGRR